MSDNQLEVTFHNNLDELGSCCLAVGCFLEDRDAEPGVADSASLVLEELVGRTVRYGYEDDEIHEIVVTLTLEPDRLELQIEDDARESSPLDGAVRELTRSLEYHRVGDRNVTVVEIEVP